MTERPFIKFPDKATLDAIQMPDADKMTIPEYREYYLEPAGRNHYRLLHWLSCVHFKTNKPGEHGAGVFFDIGTMRGTSAMALAANPDAFVISYDIVDQRDPGCVKSNITYRLDSVMNNPLFHPTHPVFPEFILLDIPHDGIFERDLCNFLIDNGFKGLLMIDDIHLDPVKNTFWNSVLQYQKYRKYDLTHIGHFSGTGLVDFSDNGA